MSKPQTASTFRWAKIDSEWCHEPEIPAKELLAKKVEVEDDRGVGTGIDAAVGVERFENETQFRKFLAEELNKRHVSAREEVTTTSGRVDLIFAIEGHQCTAEVKLKLGDVDNRLPQALCYLKDMIASRRGELSKTNKYLPFHVGFLITPEISFVVKAIPAESFGKKWHVRVIDGTISQCIAIAKNILSDCHPVKVLDGGYVTKWCNLKPDNEIVDVSEASHSTIIHKKSGDDDFVEKWITRFHGMYEEVNRNLGVFREIIAAFEDNNEYLYWSIRSFGDNSLRVVMPFLGVPVGQIFPIDDELFQKVFDKSSNARKLIEMATKLNIAHRDLRWANILCKEEADGVWNYNIVDWDNGCIDEEGLWKRRSWELPCCPRIHDMPPVTITIANAFQIALLRRKALGRPVEETDAEAFFKQFVEKHRHDMFDEIVDDILKFCP